MTQPIQTRIKVIHGDHELAIITNKDEIEKWGLNVDPFWHDRYRITIGTIITLQDGTKVKISAIKSQMYKDTYTDDGVYGLPLSGDGKNYSINFEIIYIVELV